jgi:hypothetical protein
MTTSHLGGWPRLRAVGAIGALNRLLSVVALATSAAAQPPLVVEQNIHPAGDGDGLTAMNARGLLAPGFSSAQTS